MPRVLAAVLVIASAALYFARQQRNPPGFFIDESSVAYNALTIARHGVDEHGEPFPLYFRAFGEYKNPVYIYLLAGVLRVAPPSNLVARRLSAALGFVAAAVMALLAWRISRRRWIAAVTFLTTLFTPALFEISRLAFEVAAFPLVLALFLLAVHAASRRERWTAANVVPIAITLALVTYTYSSGRILGPLYAVGLFVFASRARRVPLIATAALFVVLAVVPLLLFHARHSDALTARAKAASFFTFFQSHPVDVIAAFERNYVANALPLGLSVRGDPNTRHHVRHSGGIILLMTFILAAASAIITLRAKPRDRWWVFVVYASLVSVVPAAITEEIHHALRLSAYPLMLIALSIAGLQNARRAIVVVALVLGVIQVAWFQQQFHRMGPARHDEFEVGMRRVVAETLAQPARPIHIHSVTLKVHVLWYAAQHGAGAKEFVVLPETEPPPAGALVIGYGGDCEGCTVVSRHGPFTGYRMP